MGRKSNWKGTLKIISIYTEQETDNPDDFQYKTLTYKYSNFVSWPTLESNWPDKLPFPRSLGI